MKSKIILNTTLSAVAFWVCLALCPGMARADYASQVLALNPVDYWQLNVPSTSVAITNLGSAGSAANASFVSGANQSAVAGLQPPPYYGFPSGNNSVSNAAPNTSAVGINCGTTGNLSGTTDFTLMAWVRILTANIQANGVTILCQRDSSGSGYNGAYRFELSSAGKVAFTAYNGSFEWGGTITSPGSVSDGNWHQIACVRSSGAGIIYVDGVQVTSVAGTAVSLVSSLGTYIAYNQRDGTLSGNSYWGEFKGNLAQVAVFNTALSATTITNLYSAAFVAGAVPTPSFSPTPGIYAGATTVTMSSEAGSTVFYTTDGSNPTNTSSHGTVGAGTASFTLVVPSSVTIKTYATNSGKTDSLIASGVFTDMPAGWTGVWTNLVGDSWGTGANWTNSAIPSMAIPANGTGVTADFSQLFLTGGETVTLDGSRTIGNLLFDDLSGSANTWTLSTGTSGTLTLATSSGSPGISNNVATTIGCVLAGTNGLTKSGNATLTFSGGNTYTGNTIINGGTLDAVEATDYYHCWVGSGVAVNSGATFQVGNYFVTGFAQGISGNTNRPANMVVNDGGTVNLNGWPTYIENLTMNGSGTVTSSGDLRVCANVAATSDASGAPSISFMGLVGGTYTDAGSVHTFTVNHGAGSTATVDLAVGPIDQATSGTAPSLVKTGAGTLALTGANSYAGATVVSNGTLLVNGSLAAGSAVTVSGGTLGGTGSIGGTVTVTNGGTLEIGGTGIGTLTINNTVALASGTTNLMRVNKTSGVLTADKIAGTGSLALGGTLVVTATGDALAHGDTFMLLAKGSYSGSFAATNLPTLTAPLLWDTSSLTVNGSIRVYNPNTVSLPTFSPVAGNYIGAQTVTISTDAGSTIYYTTDGSTPTTSSAHAVNPITGITIPVGTTMTVKAYATHSGFSDSPVATAVYTTIPAAVWTNLASGSWTVSGNWLDGVIPSASGITADFSTLTMNSNEVVTLDGAQTIGTLLFGDQSGNAYTWTLNTGGGGPLTLAVPSGSPVISNGVATTFGCVLAGTNGLSKNGDATLTFSGANTYSGATIVNAGILTVTKGPDYYHGWVGSSVTVNSGATFQLGNDHVTGFAQGIGGNTNRPADIVVNDGGTFDKNGHDTYIENLTLAGSGVVIGTGAFDLSGNLAASSDAAGAPSISDMNLMGGTYSDSGNTRTLTVTHGSGSTSSVDLTIGVIDQRTPSAVPQLVKAGAGTMLLNGANIYTGLTTVSNGTLLVTGSIGSGGAAVMTNAVLTGTGTIGGTVTVNDGGTLAPGTTNLYDSLTISTLNLAGNIVFDISKNGGSPANNSVQGISTVTFGGTLTVTDITGDGSLLAQGDTFYLFSATTKAGSFASYVLPALPSGLTWDLSGLATSGSIAVSATASTPIFSPIGGGYVGAQTVSISSLTPGATIWYGTDGVNFTSNSSPATVVVPVNTANETIYAYATAPSYTQSATVSATYNTVATPAWTQPSGGSWWSTPNWSNNVVANGVGLTADFSTLTLAGDATVTLDASATVGQLVFADVGNTYAWNLADGGNGPLTLATSSSKPVIDVTTTTASITATLAGTNGFRKSSAGTLVLGGANTCTGGTTLSQGAIKFSTASAFGSGTITLGDASTSSGNLAVLATADVTLGQPVVVNSNALGTVTLGVDAGVGGSTWPVFSGAISLNHKDLILQAGQPAGTGHRTDFTGGISGTGNITITAAEAGCRALFLGATNTFVGNLSIVSGAALQIGQGGSTSEILPDTSDVNVDGKLSLAMAGSSNPNTETIGALTGSGVVIGVVSGNPNFNAGIDTLVVGGGNHSGTFSGVLEDQTNVLQLALTKIGTGTETLTGSNNYTGPTIVSNGTLVVNGSLAAGSAAYVAPTATLTGTGVIGGSVTNDGIITPGSATGTLTIGGALTLDVGSTSTFAVNGSTVANNSIALGSSVSYGGTLSIVPTGTFTNGQTFTLFSGAGAASASNFAGITGSPGGSLQFEFTNGVLSVISSGPSGPARLTNSVSGNTLNLSWPAGQGWRLQMQTNNLATGLGTNWTYVTDGSISSTNIMLDPTKPTVFYRLAYP